MRFQEIAFHDYQRWRVWEVFFLVWLGLEVLRRQMALDSLQNEGHCADSVFDRKGAAADDFDLGWEQQHFGWRFQEKVAKEDLGGLGREK